MASRFTFLFRLDTDLNSDEYIKIIFPFPLHGQGGVLDLKA